jgi:hypothetical protein
MRFQAIAVIDFRSGALVGVTELLGHIVDHGAGASALGGGSGPQIAAS